MSERVTLFGKPVAMGALRQYVFSRDRLCMAYMLDHTHQCRGQWEIRHLPNDVTQLTLEHVKLVHGLYDGRKSDECHTVPLCLSLNGTSIASHTLREFMRDHLRRLYPQCIDYPEGPVQSGLRNLPASKETP
jgi:hypothetical protein